MTRLLTLSLVAACAFVASAAPQQPVFRGTSDAVRVFVTVTDKDGRLIPGLKQEDFEIKDEGKPQPITLFDNSPQPVRLVAMLDVSGSMEGNLPLLRAASEQLFARLGPNDVARVGTALATPIVWNVARMTLAVSQQARGGSRYLALDEWALGAPR